MSDQDKIIRLAEWMGHTVAVSGALHGDGPLYGQFVFRGDGYAMADIKLFNPLTDANDCEALIRALNKREYAVTIEHYSNGSAIVDIWQDMTSEDVQTVSCDDYKQGVVELALKVIDNET